VCDSATETIGLSKLEYRERFKQNLDDSRILSVFRDGLAA
jgi:hypothetical protein